MPRAEREADLHERIAALEAENERLRSSRWFTGLTYLGKQVLCFFFVTAIVLGTAQVVLRRVPPTATLSKVIPTVALLAGGVAGQVRYPTATNRPWYHTAAHGTLYGLWGVWVASVANTAWADRK
jgi:FtsH-binding integral membrane protein